MQNVVVDLPSMAEYQDEEGTIRYDQEAGEVEISGPDEKLPPLKRGEEAFDDNLAKFLDEKTLRKVADDLVDCFDRDAEARKPWEERLARGMEIVGYVPEIEDDAPFPGASSVVYPIIAEAVTQFNARVMDELYPASGPVKTVVIGRKTAEKEASARRVEDYMNYQITEEDPGWQDEDDRLTMRLPLDGHAWKKVYHDERRNIRTSRYVSAHDVFAPYSATTTHTIPRLCHRYYSYPNEVRFEQLVGNWLDVKLSEPPGLDSDEPSEVQEAIDEAEGSERTDEDQDAVHQILEFYVDYDLPCFEHVSLKTRERTGLQLPYIITVEYHSRQVLRIVRNWKEDDERYNKATSLIAFRFLPGLGFYGFGFLHIIGGLNEAATGAVRALLNSAAWDNLQGGFITKDAAGIQGGSMRIAMGEYIAVNATAEELSRGLWAPPRHPPSEALFRLLGMLIEAGKSFTSTTEAMTGAGATTGPVGTTLALIEQGNKVFSGIHKRMHKAKRDEYRMLAKLNGQYIPEGGYPYEVGEESREVYGEDFGPAVDVLPVSDPNIFSSHQRIALNQALLELADGHPQLYHQHEVHRRMLDALKIPSIDDVLKKEDEPEPTDPVTENMRIMTGQAAKAFFEQNHEAHIAVHQAFMQHPGFGGNPDVQKIVGPIMMAHLAEHVALLYQQRMIQTAGIPFLPSGVGGGQASEEEAPEVPPEAQDQMAMMAALATEPFMQTSGLPAQEDPAQAQAQAEQAKAQAQIEMQQQKLQIDQAKAQLDMALKEAQAALQQAQAAAEENRKQAAFIAEEQRKQAQWAADQARTEQVHGAELSRAEEKADKDLELADEKAKAAAAAAKAKAKAQPKPKPGGSPPGRKG